jgi:hypothetical protein
MKRATAAAGALALAACVASPVAVAPGAYDGAGGYSVTLERTWTEMPKGYSAHTDAGYLTFDGPQLNQVHLLNAIPSGEGFVKEQRDGQPVPVYRAGVTAIEIVEFVTQSVALFGYQNVTAQDVRPRALAGAEGVSFQFTGVLESGLRVKGSALAAESAGALDLMVFIAPEMHYYDAFAPEVERMFDSARR